MAGSGLSANLLNKVMAMTFPDLHSFFPDQTCDIDIDTRCDLSRQRKAVGFLYEHTQTLEEQLHS